MILNERITSLLDGVKTLAVVCNQWGDTGKGKYVDYFAEWADVIARGTGGANAGHTISLGGKEHVFHLVPSGILHDGNGKINIIGTGVAFDPGIVCSELKIISDEGLTYKNMRISRNAKLVLPQHLVLDRVRESSSDGKIGTTGRGIGPLYQDHYARSGLVVNDLLNPEIFARKLKKNLQEKIKLLHLVDPEVIKQIMQHEHLANGRYWSEKDFFDVDAIVEMYCNEYGKFLAPMIRDTDQELRDMIGKKKVLLEGAQGILLSIDYGTYPYVTSSDCSISGLAKGVGLKDKDVDLTLGIAKIWAMTRVGDGPFPTELGGEKSAEWCATKGVTKTTEKEKYGALSVNDPDEFLQGIGIRFAGGEYGATTGRPRRIGWLDLPLLRHAMQFNGNDLILTKADVLDACEKIKICVAYEYTGEKYLLGDKILNKGDRLEVAVTDVDVIKNCRPIYEEFAGWNEPSSHMRTLEDLPKNFRTILDFVTKQTGMRVRIISVGPDRDETIVL